MSPFNLSKDIFSKFDAWVARWRYVEFKGKFFQMYRNLFQNLDLPCQRTVILSL